MPRPNLLPRAVQLRLLRPVTGAGDQYTTFAGVVIDGVARVELFTATGNRIEVPLRDNTYLVDVALARLPAKMVAYDSEGRVIGIQETPRDEGPARVTPRVILDLTATVPRCRRPRTARQQDARRRRVLGRKGHRQRHRPRRPDPRSGRLHLRPRSPGHSPPRPEVRRWAVRPNRRTQGRLRARSHSRSASEAGARAGRADRPRSRRPRRRPPEIRAPLTLSRSVTRLAPSRTAGRARRADVRQAQNECGLTPLRTRGIDRVRLHADLVVLAPSGTSPHPRSRNRTRGLNSPRASSVDRTRGNSRFRRRLRRRLRHWG